MTNDEIKAATETVCAVRYPGSHAQLSSTLHGPMLEVRREEGGLLYGLGCLFSDEDTKASIEAKVGALIYGLEVNAARRAYVNEHGPMTRARAKAEGRTVIESAEPHCLAKFGGFAFSVPVVG